MTELVDATRVALALIAGGTMLQLAIITWQDHQAGRRWCFHLQATVLLALLLAALDPALRLGEPVRLHLLIGHAAIVLSATTYTLGRQGLVPRRRAE